jgi:hypothetical protein
MKSVYWVFTLRCNDFCDHCYNDSGPRGDVVETADLLKVIPNLPRQTERLILSGGEPLTEMPKLLALIAGLREHYGDSVKLWLQSNGDLLNQRRLETLLEAGIDRIDITSMDRFHRKQGGHAERLRALFEAAGMAKADDEKQGIQQGKGAVYSLWGANEDIWLGGNWARGRALEKDVAYLNPDHNFCSLWSGALGFLDEGSERQEVHIQLYRLYPCCPTTYYALGDVRSESVEDILEGARGSAAFGHLNRGDVHSLGREEGLSAEYIHGRIQQLGDVCLWCDEYFTQHNKGPKGEARRGASQLLHIDA